MSRLAAIISAIVICLVVCLGWLASHYHDNATEFKRQRDKATEQLSLAKDTIAVLWSSFFGHADQMVGLCTGGQLGGRAGQRFVLCG
ncbi:bacteriophage lysis protein [Klebsiella pneumoniae]|nr:bacteriophage lysis protein [Klebsiella pneumoniae]SBZ32647.1 bacteriophage lysis protein [Klebsiella pneumoniae]SBZ82450.1 bacteriophage lysis protein [Klebsiella pneumoniae]